MRELVFAGFGGQGVLTIGLIITNIAVAKGKKATWIPSYGLAMRGGTANCTIKYGDDMIYNPSQEEPDILLAMNTPSFDKFINIVKPGGKVIINKDMVNYDKKIREDVEYYEIPCNSLANDIEHNKGANIIMTGAIIKILDDFLEDESVEGMNRMF